MGSSQELRHRNLSQAHVSYPMAQHEVYAANTQSRLVCILVSASGVYLTIQYNSLKYPEDCVEYRLPNSNIMIFPLLLHQWQWAVCLFGTLGGAINIDIEYLVTDDSTQIQFDATLPFFFVWLRRSQCVRLKVKLSRRFSDSNPGARTVSGRKAFVWGRRGQYITVSKQVYPCARTYCAFPFRQATGCARQCNSDKISLGRCSFT